MTHRDCNICGDNDFELISEFNFGLWEQGQERELERINVSYDIISCKCCSHLMAVVPGGEKFINSLYDGPIGKEVWDTVEYDYRQPYNEMVTFCCGHIDIEKLEKIIDFGCGNGELLHVLHHNFKIDCDCLLGVDYSNNLDEEFPFVSGNLNQLSQTGKNSQLSEFSLGFCCHVLEHLWEPRNFIRELRKNACEHSYLYLEVPDHGILNDKIIQHSNLFNAQHINYFTLESLKRLSVSCGWDIISEESVIFGFTPRAKLLLKASSDNTGQENTLKTITGSDEIIKAAADEILNNARCAKMNIWGVGGDLMKMIVVEPRLKSFINKGNIKLFDGALNGQLYEGNLIHDVSDIHKGNAQIIISPRPSRTRNKIKNIAIEMGISAERIVEIYDT